ncbi:GNAT family N-acetyltransferase [Clostridium tagluense]|uniref:GNAT family N-acetyltransferase n=1 Tax=Clostridium tagluense TaxID=360422 RepID=UPI001CF4AF9F|nr:GNAT family protein [Clostridium tagluense]MCB2312823.1 GNAT family N-acetyltransferase [Clostridium tagluense]MCB2317589.1 GNAT family N-acetyltransferase [Clostridium tagluense]MCB2322321.1 GNAT family N-acetyltransferase [Clostridium tagluense]MCB2327324.1 GNAT family N-acetyltransferase [Clostridium tagluense]MCB2332043.1 GNAT family N-acetyltransferase [Clostridium tagluense]
MFFNTIETDRLIIREFNEDDFKAIHAYASKPEVTMYLPFGPNSEMDTHIFLKKVIDYQTLKPRYDYEFAVVLKQNNILIGACGIHVTNINNKEGSIGYCYDKQYWGNGYASESSDAIINFGFEKLNLHRIFATCHPDNIASAKVMEKIGMIKEGRLREHKLQKGKWRDSFLYSILDYEHNVNSYIIHQQECKYTP